MAGYSHTPLPKKLGIKEGQRVCFFQSPKELHGWLGVLPGVKAVHRPPYDFVLLFVNEIQLLEDWLVKLRHQIT
ncbi:MAG TPA: hypothetical protein VI603_12785 [Saprospiraceae bacterium]|nr:hypothetical protein [Saprospiraceae bacterium]